MQRTNSKYVFMSKFTKSDYGFVQCCKISLTRVMKRHQNEGARQTSALALFTGLYDGEGSVTCSCDLLKHAAGGVHDKDQCWGLLDTEEPTGFHRLHHLCVCIIGQLCFTRLETGK